MRYVMIGASGPSARRVSALSLGAMRFGSTTDEATSFAILDRYVEAGGTFIDTANNYAFWVDGTQGGHSEALLGRWRASRGIGEEIVIATKLGGRPIRPGVDFSDPDRVRLDEGLSATAIREASEQSRRRLGMERLDLLYAHIEDPRVPVEETVEAFGALVADDSVGLLGVSNHRSWRIERARRHARDMGLASYEVLQYHHSYLQHRTDVPGPRSPFGDPGIPTPDLLDYMSTEPGLVMVSYSPLLSGGYVRADKAPGAEYLGPGNSARLNALHQVTAETGATPNQVVLAWLIGGQLPVIPLVGASSVAQLDESLEAVDLKLTPEQRATLDNAR